MSSNKRSRTQSSANLEPENHKKQEVDETLIGQGGRAYDHDDLEAKPVTAKEREKLGVTIGAAVYCSFEITPLYPSFFRPEVVFTSPPDDDSAAVRQDTASPSPAPPSKSKHGNHVDRLFICETCFKYTPHLNAYLTHANDRCLYVHAPPGNLVYLSPGLPDHPVKESVPMSHPRAPPGTVEPKYRDGPGYALYEMDGEEHKLFCQNLSLFAKLWVGSKSVGFDVGGFMFYVLVRMTPPARPKIHRIGKSKRKQRDNVAATVKKEEPSERSELGDANADVDRDDVLREDEDDEEDVDDPNRVVGYFSKEKNSWDSNNLACILVFPPWQGQGVGQLLIEASYHLGRKEGRFGGPERPLSISGEKSYEAYWSRTVAKSILKLSEEGKPTIKEVAEDAWIVPADVISTLTRMQWAEGFLDGKDGDGGEVDEERTVLVDRRKLSEWLDSKGERDSLEKAGWLVTDDSDHEEENEDEDDETSDSDEEGNSEDDMEDDMIDEENGGDDEEG